MPSYKKNVSKKNKSHRRYKKSSNKTRSVIRGGDAYNSIPARYIVPLSENQMAYPENGRIAGGSNSKYRRKYLKKSIKGGSGLSYSFLSNNNSQPIEEKFTNSNRFLV